ncbi:hypothetical protein GCM10023194_37840 [Planotetraspora phitsanulokensis]|uniref:Uncharacterized protein n=1 Tax=Planotetraspora phitsanulokensis TaxID=575192 RepID=A0A8J3XM07_9ACTN|nr:hypothetical protein [Planotetraspora phitsanulokensis]GII41253.1 hypothetical protein Pph01_62560 [Planotetraspora phitsanulokensis]
MKGTLLNRGDRAGVADATVSAWEVGDRPGRHLPVAAAQTDADGRFALDVPASRGDVVLRVHHGKGAADLDPRALVAVVQVPVEDRRGGQPVIWLDDRDGRSRPLFGRALIGEDPAPERLTVTASTLAGVRQKAATGRGGWFALRLSDPGVPTELRLSLEGDRPLVGSWSVTEKDSEADVVFSPPGNFEVTGKVARKADGSGLGGLRVELLDRSGQWANPVGDATTGDSGDFTLGFAQVLDTPPVPTFAVWSRDERVATVDWPAAWADLRLRDVRLVLDVPPDRPPAYRLGGQALDRAARTPVPGLLVEVYGVGFDVLLKQTSTDGDGRFSVSVPPSPDGGRPDLGLRLYRDGVRVGEQRVTTAAWHADAASVFCEVDLPPAAPAVFRVAGRLVDQVTRSGVAGLRVEAWDKVPRPGGLLGAATYTAQDGTFDLALPADVPPALFFRLYAADALVATLDDEVGWDAAGTGTVLLEIAGVPRPDGEVVLHELGETIATAVNRMQSELARYPSTVGAYVVDELDLSVPVAVQLDRLGQVRAKVVDRAPVDEQLGQIRMRVRPVLGARLPYADQLDQPLSVLTELSADAVARLNALRVYSVEDLARLASAPAGSAALAGLNLGVDLAALLDKVALLSLTVLPRPVREALILLGVSSPRAFADHPDPAALAAALSVRLGQDIGVDAVTTWARLVRDGLAIPLPSITEETIDEHHER